MIVTDCSSSKLGCTFVSNTNFSTDKTQEKYYFRNQTNSLGPPTSCHPVFPKNSQKSIFAVVCLV